MSVSRRGAAAAAAALLALPLPGLWLAPEQGRPLLRPAWPGMAFALDFVHSVYGVAVRERFRVGWRVLSLEAVEVPRAWSAELADYYGFVPDPGARDAEGAAGRALLRPPAPTAHRELLIGATERGRRTFDDGRCRVPLSRLAGTAGRVRMRVRWLPLAAWLHVAARGDVRCPTP